MIETVWVDSREPDGIKRQDYGAAPTVMELAAGDVWVTTDAGELLIFERKEARDLLGSIADGRLFQQVCAMREQTDWVYLIITGTMEQSPDGYVIANGRETRWKWNSVRGVLAEVQERGVTVWETGCGDDKFGETVQTIAKRDRRSVKPIMPRVETQKVTPDEQILMALPGIGYDRARDLLGAFGHIPVLALAWLTDLHAIGDVGNIGKATKRRAREAMGMTDDMELCIVTSGATVSPKATVYVEADDPLAASLVAAL